MSNWLGGWPSPSGTMTLSVIRKLCCVVTGSIDYGVRTDLDGSPGSTTSRLGACLAGTDFSPVRELLPPHSTMAVVLGRQPQHTASLAAMTGPGVAQPESFPEFFQVEPLEWGVGAYLHCNPELLRSFLTSPVGIYWKQVRMMPASSEKENPKMGRNWERTSRRVGPPGVSEVSRASSITCLSSYVSQ